jgi:hypothetical protein
MTKEITETRRIPVREAYDLIVVGGGIAGITAALAGSRHGLSTMLIEKSTILGGLATLGLVNWYEPLCDGEGNVMTTGIAEELIRLSAAYGYSSLPDHWKEPGKPNKDPQKRYAAFFNPSVFALALNDLVIKEHIELRYDIVGSYPVMEGSRCTGVITESTGGREYFPAEVVIDATGEAGIMARAGVPCRQGTNYLTYWAHGCTGGSMRKVLEKGDMLYLNDVFFQSGSDLEGKGHPEGLHVFSGVSGEERSEYVRLGQAMLFEKIKKAEKNTVCLYTLPGMIQFRKIRCIAGSKTFSGKEEGKHREDSIGAAGDFRKAGRHYEFPFGILFNQNFPNLLAAGRIVSAEGDGWEITRVIPSAALTGEASGIAASLVVKEKKDAGELDIKEIQKLLEAGGVRLHF